MPARGRPRGQGAPPNADEQRRRDRRNANREAANRCRQRRREGYHKLKQDYLDYDCKNVQIQQEIRELSRMKEQLEQILRSHQCVLHQVAGAGGATGDREGCPASGSRNAAPAAALGAPPDDQPQGQGQGQNQGHVTVNHVAAPQASSSATQASLQGHPSNQGQAHDNGLTSVAHALPTLPAAFQLQLLDRFSVGLGMDAELSQSNSEASNSGNPGTTDNEDLLDERYELRQSLYRDGDASVPGVGMEHSYCQGSDSSQPPS